ncbi:MAG: VCBS repeat-containing protein [Planctomycetes bacterium]|nr:VCBS repeat-containing protein [Planctomycetota bacterium]
MNFRSMFSWLGAALCATGLSAQITTTQLLNSGSTGAKKDIVIIGDGFTAADQSTYNTWVNDTVMAGMFSRDVFRDAMNGFNVWRVNVNSADSGVTQVDANGNVTVARNTALGYRYSGIWSRCWMEAGPATNLLVQTVLNATVPSAEYVFIVLNETGGGGCAGGSRLVVTRASGWSTCAHEMGHMVGGLGDEYTGGSSTYSGAEPTRPNLTTQTSRSLIKWNKYIPSSRAVPTATSAVTDAVNDVGLFEGATTGTSKWRYGLYRPTVNGRMVSNSPEFGPVCYEAWRDALNGFEAKSFARTYVGDFNGDAKDDCVIHNSNSFQLFLSDGAKLVPTWGNTGSGQNSSIVWHVGDFNGDGKDDLYRILPGNRVSMLRSNGTSFTTLVTYGGSLPSWQMGAGDRFLVGDWNGDGKDDLMVWNHTTWGTPYIGFYRSTGTGLQVYARFDNAMPGWQMAAGDKYHVGDFNGDGRDEICAFNGTSWSLKWFGMFRSTGTGIAHTINYSTQFAGWNMGANDQHFVGDFDNDGDDDVYTFNGANWSIRYLGMMRSNGTSFSTIAVYNGAVPGWNMGTADKFTVADVNADGRDDLVAFNTTNYTSKYLGIFRSTGTGVSATYQTNQIGGWNFGTADSLLAANFNGGVGAVDLFIRNPSWFGLLRSNSTSFSLVKAYPKYIRNVPFHANGWW